MIDALKFARIKHDGQFRKGTNEPYVNHCERVQTLVEQYTDSKVLSDAAATHDTYEDTETTIKEIIDGFGIKVAVLVIELTNVYTSEAYPDLNRKSRKTLEINRISGISKDAALIKACDRIDNIRDMAGMKDGFKRTYLAETEQLFSAIADKLPKKLRSTFLEEIEKFRDSLS